MEQPQKPQFPQRLHQKIATTFGWVMKGNSGVAATIQTFLFEIIIRATNILTGILTAQALGKSGRGEQGAIVLWPNLLGSIFALGIGPALLYNLKKNPEEESELYSAALVMGSVLGLMAAAFGLAIIPRMLDQYPKDTVLIAQLFVLTAPATLLNLIMLNAYKARGLFSVVNQANYLAPLITLMGLAGLFIFKAMTPLTAALSYRIAFLVIFFWKFIDLWQYYKPSTTNLKRSTRKLLSYSWRSAGINILSQVADRIDQLLVVTFLEPGMMGLYIVALGMAQILTIIQKSIITVLFPKAAAKPVQEVTELAGRAARISALLSLGAAIPLIIFGPIILPVLYGPDFIDAVAVFQLLSIEVVLKGATLVLAQAFMAVGRPGIVTLLQGLGLALSFPLMFLLIPNYGLVGTGLALLCSTIVRLVFILACFPIVLKIAPPNLIPKIADLKFLLKTLSRRSQPSK